MITTSTSINIHKELGSGKVTNYTSDKVSLFLLRDDDNTQKKFVVSAIINSTKDSTGSIVFNDIPLWGDGSYSFYITLSDGVQSNGEDLNSNKLATGYFKKISSINTILV